MGAVNFSIDVELIKVLKNVIPLDVFVETGTFKGDTVNDVINYFNEIHSVELSKEYYNSCKERFKEIQTVNLYLDDSASFLKQLRKSFSKKSILYWLDAHWCVADKTAGEKSQCPLLDEINAIKSLNDRSIIVIDDARLFISPPPDPHEISQWPDFNSVIDSLRQLNSHHRIMILNDTIVFYPEAVQSTIFNYAHKNSVDWLLVMHKTREYNNLRLEFDGLQEQFNNLLSQLKEKDVKIFSLSDDLNIKEETIISLSDDLKNKDKEIVFLGESLNILKKRLSTPIWGILTLFQHHFPHLWNYLYEKKKQISLRNSTPNEKRSLGFFTPRLGILNHYPPVNLKIPQKYFNDKLKMESLKISIVTPSFNQGIFLEKTIDSIVRQDYKNIEYIIYDACSDDETQIVLKNITHKKIKYYIEKDNGQANAINKGFTKSSGDIMAWINSDDIYLPGTFNYVVNYFNTHPETDVIYGHRVLIDTNEKEIGRWVLPPHDKKVLYWADFIPQETLFWRRKIWDKVGASLNEEFNFALDWELLLRFQETGTKIERVPRFLASFRVHPQQKTSAQISTLGEREMSRVRIKYLGRDPVNSEIKKKIFFYLLKSEFLNKLYHLRLLRY